MKKNVLLVALALGLSINYSCKKDKDDGGAAPEKFSTLTVEENKQVIEDAGIELAGTLDDMANMQTVDVAVNLGDILGQSDPFATTTGVKSKVAITIGAIASLGDGGSSLDAFYANLKSPAELKADPQTAQEAWNEIVGTYNWNPTLSDWDKVAASDAVTLNFPSTETSQTNDAQIKVSNYQSVTVSTPLEPDYTGDIPTALKMELNVGTTNYITFTYAASLNADGIPDMLALDLKVEDYVWSVDITNNSKEVSGNYKFVAGTKTIFDMGAAANGDFSEANIDANTYTETYTYTWYDYNPATGNYDIEVTEVDEWEEVDFEEIAHTANAHFRILDLELRGDVNIKPLVDAMDVIYADEDNPDFDWDATDSLEVIEINKYIDLRLMDMAAGTKIADAEAYVATDSDEWGEWSYIDFRLVFGDGSRIDMETYFTEGFDDFINEINGIITDINTKYELTPEEQIDLIVY